ncbi:MAG: GWxTD domain-containing protein, partial [Gemmatimonadota bacterium]|nr:GWxTD domain-containing protein [Gemmatimonadota bacterium]
MVFLLNWKRFVFALLIGALCLAPCSGTLLAQDVTSFENEIPFGLRMNFFKGTGDSTRCLVTVAVNNLALLFLRGKGVYEAKYEVFLSLRESESGFLVQRGWEKSVRVPGYDQTSLAERDDPMQNETGMLPGKYEGFIEIKDLQANTYGNGRISIIVPDFRGELPKLSTPRFLGSRPDSSLSGGTGGDPIHSAGLKYPSGKPIFLLVEVYADSAAAPESWTIEAEVVKEMMVFPRVRQTLTDGMLTQRMVLEIPTKTMGLGSYEVEVTLRDKDYNKLARASSFSFKVIKSAQWIEANYENEVRYLKYLATEHEMKQLLKIDKDHRPAALKKFWEKADPVPATAVNELKLLYFERIEYANNNFTTEDKDGWET